MLCENEHNNHNMIYFGEMIINKDNLLKENDEFEKIIYKLKNNIEKIKNILSSYK